jgi:PhzF family phenazine biosynthesis protein
MHPDRSGDAADGNIIFRHYQTRRQVVKQYIVDAFTDKPFSGNPAAVCVMDKWPKEDFMMKLAMENNLSETAFIVKEEQGYHLRWFTPGSE